MQGLSSFSTREGYIHFLGGDDGSSFSRAHDQLDVTASFMTSKSPLPVLGRSGTSSFTVGDNGVIVAGAHLGNSYTTDLLVYDDANDTWSTSVGLVMGMLRHFFG